MAILHNMPPSMRPSGWCNSSATNACACGWILVAPPKMICNAPVPNLPSNTPSSVVSILRHARPRQIGPGLLSRASMRTANRTSQARRATPNSNTITARWNTKPRGGSLIPMGVISLSRTAVASGDCGWWETSTSRSKPSRSSRSSEYALSTVPMATTCSSGLLRTRPSSTSQRGSRWASTWDCSPTTPLPMARRSTTPGTFAVPSND